MINQPKQKKLNKLTQINETNDKLTQINETNDKLKLREQHKQNYQKFKKQQPAAQINIGSLPNFLLVLGIRLMQNNCIKYFYYDNSVFTQNNQDNIMQQEQSSSPIHNRLKPEPFMIAPKRRRLSISNHGPKELKDKELRNTFLNIYRKKNKKKHNNSISVSEGETKTTIQSNYVRIQNLRQEEKTKINNNAAQTKNMQGFLPTYTTIVGTQNKDLTMYRGNFSRNGKAETFRLRADSDKGKGYEIFVSQRQRLVPIRKQTGQESPSKANMNLNFMNIEKVNILPFNPNQTLHEVHRTKNSYTAAILNSKRALFSPRHSFDQRQVLQISEHQQIGLEKYDDNIENNKGQKYGERQKISVEKDTEITSLMSKTSHVGFIKYEVAPSNRLLRPFNPPFEKYYYFDFLWKIAYSNHLKAEFLQSLPRKYKVFIGPGNNSMLIKTFFKRRQSWWTITDKIQQANFIWTQIKINNVLNKQRNCNYLPPVASVSLTKQEEANKKKIYNFQYKRNRKILNQPLLENWSYYYERNKENEEKLLPSFGKRNKILKNSNIKALQGGIDKVKVHNHLPRNYILGNKKALFATMKKYYELSNLQVFSYLPLTFHIQNGLDDKQYLKFLQYYYKKAKLVKQSQKNGSPGIDVLQKVRNIWIVKPGQFTNRGNGIIVCHSLEQIRNIVRNKRKLDNGNNRTYIVQQYLDRPFLYCRRKFDIRHYMLITSINGHLKGYWYQLGYIRTTSYQYSVKNSFSSVHLTNDAVQKMLPDYGRYEKGNKISYQDFQKYLERQYKGKYSFYKTIYPQMRKIAHDSMRASALFIDQDRKQHNFEIFGFDFMIDSSFQPWLIEINTNPCLELSCPVLMDVIPDMVQNALKIGVDSILLPPHSFPEKRPRFNSNILEDNKFELLYDSTIEEQTIKCLYSPQRSQSSNLENITVGKVKGQNKLNLNFKQLQKNQQQIYEDDGVQLDDD